MFAAILLFVFVSNTSAALHGAKRAINFCGFSPVDCGNGWCCSFGTNCTRDDPPMCADLLIPSLTYEAAPYSALDPARLTSVGLTISTFPSTTMTATTALPTYSDGGLNGNTGSRNLLFTKPTAVGTVGTEPSPSAGRSGLLLKPDLAIAGPVALCVGVLIRG